MKGLKPVSHRRADALARVGWDHLETLLAAYYRSEGYDVEHVGTGATGARFDGGIDLKLRRGEQFIVVQCKHWNAMKVPHNAVHELLGLMVNHGATGAILATSGEFTKAAIEAAQRLGHVQLIDGDELRMMLGPVREPGVAFDSVRMGGEVGAGATFARRVGERLLSAAEDRVRYGGSGRRRRATSRSLAGIIAFKLIAFVLFALFMLLMYKLFVGTITQFLAPGVPHATVPAAPAQVSGASSTAMQPARNPCHEIIDARSGSTIDHCVKVEPRPVSAAEARGQQRKADEAMETIADSTPEL